MKVCITHYIVLTVGYYNITTGIKDPSIFDPPAGCQPSAGVSNETFLKPHT